MTQSFLRKILTLSSFAAVSQALAFAVSPILSRLFAPEMFGWLSVLQSLSSLVLYVAAGRYDTAILVPADDAKGDAVFHVGVIFLFCSTAVTVVAGLIISAVYQWRNELSFLNYYWWIIPLSQWAGGLYLCFSSLAMRRQAIRQLALSRLSSTGSTIATQLGLGLCGFTPIGLFLGEPVGLLMRSFPLLRQWPKQSLWGNFRLGKLTEVAREYRAYPLFGVWGTLLGSTARYTVPTVLLSLYGASAAGYYALTMRVLAAPLDLIGRGCTEVLIGTASSLKDTDPVELGRLMRKSALVLFAIGCIPASLAVVFGPACFAWLFGAQWAEAGTVARYTAVMLPFWFVNYPLVHFLNLLEKPHWQAIWDAGLIVVGPLGLIGIHRLGHSYLTGVAAYATAMAVMFCVHYGLSLRAMRSYITMKSHCPPPIWPPSSSQGAV